MASCETAVYGRGTGSCASVEASSDGSDLRLAADWMGAWLAEELLAYSVDLEVSGVDCYDAAVVAA